MSALAAKNHGGRPAGVLPSAAKRPGTSNGPAAKAPELALPVRVPVHDERYQVDMVWAIHNPDWAELLVNGGSIRISALEGE